MAPSFQLQTALERPHRLGMIGGELEEQLAHCASFSFALTEALGSVTPATAVDLGTGGGLPGLALAWDFTDTSWTLIDLRANRAMEVERAVLGLGLADRVEVFTGAAQDFAHGQARESFDVAVARAFGPPSLVAECAAGLVVVGGVLVVSEPPNAPTDRWPPAGLKACGFSPPRPIEHAGHHFVTLTKRVSVSPALPRRPPKGDRGWPSI